MVEFGSMKKFKHLANVILKALRAQMLNLHNISYGENLYLGHGTRKARVPKRRPRQHKKG